MAGPVTENGTPWNQLPGATGGIRRHLTAPPANPMQQLEKVFLSPFARIAAELTGGDPEDWDTIEEIIDNIVGAIPAAADFIGNLLSGVIPIGLLAPTIPNLLANGEFDGSVSIVEGDGWVYDPDVGRTSPGAARYDCTGVAGMQLSTPVQVAEGQKVAASVYAKWAGVAAGSGAGIRLVARWYNGESLVSTSEVGAVVAPAASGGWSKLSGEMSTPSGVDTVCLALVVDAGVSAGQVWWDDASLTKPTASLPQQWITGLVDDLGEFLTMLDQIASIVAGGAVTAINGIVQDFKDGWTSTSNWIQDIINAILRAIRRVPVVGGTIADIIAEVGGLNDRTDQANQSVASVSSQVSFVADVIAVRSGVGLWESGPDPTGIVSFPYSMLMLHSHTTSVTGSTGTRDGASSSTGFTSAGGDNHSHSVYSTSHSHDAGSLKVSVGMGVPTINATASWAPWASVRFPSSADRQVFTFLASKSGSVTSFFVDVYRLNANGSSSYVASSTDQSGNVGGALAWQQVILPAIPVEIGDVLEVQFRVAGSGTVQIAGINLPYPTPISGFRPYAPGSGRDPSGSATPAEIAIGVRDSMYQGPVPFVSVGIDLGQTAIPRYFYDDFNRGSLGPRWSTSGNIGVSGNRVQHRGGVLESGTATATYSQQLLTDNARVEFDLSAGSGIAGVGACCSSTLGSGLWFVVDSGSCSIQTGSAGSRTQRASGAGGDGRYVGTWTASDTTARLYRNGELVASWVDSASVVPHGDGRRWCALIVSKPPLLDSGRIDNWVAADVVPQ